MNLLKKSFYRDAEMPPNVKEILDRRGDAIITGVVVGRTPVQQLVQGIIRQVADIPYDNLFHLFVILDTTKGKVLLEKIERINAEVEKSINRPDAEYLTVNSIPSGLTVNQLIENTKNQMGDKFYPYGSYKNNCQYFIQNILTANGMNDTAVLDFVKQDTEFIFKNNPAFRKLANTATNLATSANILMQGGGKFKNNELTNYQLQDLMAKYRLQYNGSYVKDKLPTVLRNGNYIIN